MLATCLQCGIVFATKPNIVKRGWGKYCSQKCAGKGRHGNLVNAGLRRTVAERFWSKVEKPTGEDGCWLWTAGLVNGYGHFRLPSGQCLAHRMSWELANGPVPEGLCVLHKCDNPRCVNPEHLFIGTRADNNRDRAAKGRSITGDNHWTHYAPERLPRGANHWRRLHPEQIPRGDLHPTRKVSAEDVREIRRLYALGGISQRELGLRYGITRSAVGKITRNQNWAMEVSHAPTG